MVIDDFSATPKYIQLVNAIIKAINEGKDSEKRCASLHKCIK